MWVRVVVGSGVGFILLVGNSWINVGKELVGVVVAMVTTDGVALVVLVIIPSA